MKSYYDVIVIGGGPAGLAAAVAACDKGADVLVIERDREFGKESQSVQTTRLRTALFKED